MRARDCLSCLVLAGALFAPPSFASDRAAPSYQLSESRFKEGMDLAAQGDWERARILFAQSYSAFPGVDVLWNLAVSETFSGHPIEALYHFDKYVREPEGDGAKREQIPAISKEIRLQTGHVEVQSSGPVRVVVDGQPLPEAILPGYFVHVMPGAHTLRIQTAAGEGEYHVDLAAGQTMKLDLREAPVSPPVRRGIPTKVWVAGGVGLGALVALGLGVGFGISANRNEDRVSELSAKLPLNCHAERLDACSQLRDRLASERFDARAANVSFVVAGVLAAGSVGTYVLWRDRSREAPRVSVTPTVLPGGGALALHGVF